MKPEPGNTYGPFILVDRIARSNALQVYRAKHIHGNVGENSPAQCLDGEKIQATLYILSCTEGRLELDPDEFLKRMNKALKQSHPMIMPVVAAGRVEQTVYTATRFVKYFTLSDIIPSLRGRGLPPPLAAWLIAETSEALAILQEFVGTKESPSRDALYIAPSDVYLDRSGRVLLDRLDLTAALSATWKGSHAVLKDKFGYMSPEQIDGRPSTHKSDLFICGIMLHELLTGKALFAHKSKARTIMSIKETKVVPPSEISPWIEDRLDDIVLMALAKSPDDRPSNIRKWAESLRNYLKTRHPDFNPESARELFIRGPAAFSAQPSGGLKIKEERQPVRAAEKEKVPQAAGRGPLQNGKEGSREAGATLERFSPRIQQNTVLAEAFEDTASQPTRTAAAVPGGQGGPDYTVANVTSKIGIKSAAEKRRNGKPGRYDFLLALIAFALAFSGAAFLLFSGSDDASAPTVEEGLEGHSSNDPALSRAIYPEKPLVEINGLTVNLVRYHIASGEMPDKHTLEIHLEAEKGEKLDFKPQEALLNIKGDAPRSPLFWSNGENTSVTAETREKRSFILGFDLPAPPKSWRLILR